MLLDQQHFKSPEYFPLIKINNFITVTLTLITNLHKATVYKLMFAYLILRVHVSIQFLLCNFMRDIPTQLTVFFMTVGRLKRSCSLRSNLF
jgi:hypothetical protein